MRSRPIRCCGSAAKRHWRPLPHRRLACRAAEHLDGDHPGSLQSGWFVTWLQGPCPPTIAGHAASTSVQALTRHPCRVRSRDGGRARTCRDGRYAGLRAEHAVCCSDRIASDPLHDSTRATSSFSHDHRFTLWSGGLADCGTVWRHGCRHRAPRDGFTACPASGEPPRARPTSLLTASQCQPANPENPSARSAKGSHLAEHIADRRPICRT